MAATQKAGLGDLSTMAEDLLPDFFRKHHAASHTHPDGHTRLKALKGQHPDGMQMIAMPDGTIRITRRAVAVSGY